MALQLPYPDMDFVPLDILTAQEQDQLVANIEYIAENVTTPPFSADDIADNAITTDKIANTAVSSEKINWATMLAQTGAPIAKRTVNMGYGIQARFYRLGNMVWGTIGNPVSNIGGGGFPQHTDATTLAETIPVGYRPYESTSVLVNSTVGSTGSAAWLIETNGTMKLNTCFSAGGATRVNGSWAWMTNDIWPTA